eukprot:CAMPEP_0172558046 /NCGR_PEP_ID=MMETSP1067-20121228/76877_1 /TAXON_ID=265564 ORGANISM="Thalassiosira punctigera, Strain Tpunct2005C2" /NCGR_SAMPLE_ID=MMETSP1067 /ASSEMBLY_ACC=CAM_ASM_000444 /LENGTH=75 /DNA_ID=CAMNT_0013347299 /DNA_START=150 /DNA_END=377 /DNA_ORIENTATION=-
MARARQPPYRGKVATCPERRRQKWRKGEATARQEEKAVRTCEHGREQSPPHHPTMLMEVANWSRRATVARAKEGY